MLYLATDEGVLKLNPRGQVARLGPDCMRIRAVAPHPQDPRLLLAASDTNGVFILHKGSWQHAVQGTAHSVVWDPQGIRAYAGLRGPRLFVTDNGGTAWREDLEVRTAIEGPGLPMPHIRGHPLDVLSILVPRPGVVYLGVEAGGVLRWMHNTGWRPVSEGLHPDIHAMSFDPHSSETLYAATGAGIYRTANEGSSWAPLLEGMDRLYTSAVAVVHIPGIVLAAAAPDPPPRWNRPGGARAVLFRSTDHGSTWQRIRSGVPEEFGEEVSAIVPDPDTPERVIATVLDGQVLKSDDAGLSWRQIASGLPAIWNAAIGPG
jgi:hypothetical protein